MDNKFNLVDEPWIPVAGKGKVSLKTIFSDETITSLGGNPVEKIAVFKLLLAIAQSAYTPKDDDDWEDLGCDGMKQKVLDYLEKHHDCFWLYGEKPFLQMKEIENEIEKGKKTEKAKEPMKIGNGTFPDLLPDNSTIVSQFESLDISNSDDRKALFLLSVENFAFYGKQVNNKICLSKTISKGSIAKPGPSIGLSNYLHTFGLFKNILNSIYYNLQTETGDWNPLLGKSIGKPFWEQMPSNENDSIVNESKKTLIGHLVPLSRFILLNNDSVIITEGIVYHYTKAEKKAGKAGAEWIEQSISWKMDKDEVKGICADISKKPWRSLVSIMTNVQTDMEYENIGLRIFVDRVRKFENTEFSIWSGGLDVSGDSFGKKIKNNDDYVESQVQLVTSIYSDKKEADFFINLKSEMARMEDTNSLLCDSIVGYLLTLSGKDFRNANYKEKKRIKDSYTALPSQDFWQLCEWEFQNIINACSSDNAEEKLVPLRKKIFAFACQIYDQQCPNQTARQLEAWAKNKLRNNHSKKEE